MKKQLLILVITAAFSIRTSAQSLLDTSAVITNNKGLYSLVISRNALVGFNKQYNGKTAGELHNAQSLTKSIMSVLIGIAIDKGHITSVDQTIDTWFPEVKTVTIHHLMDQTSGLWHENLNRLGQYLRQKSPSAYTVQQPPVSEPGKEFHYNNAATHLLSVILTKATGMNTLDFARKYLFEPLQIKEVKWKKMNDGYYDGSGLESIFLSTEDMNKIGTIMVNKGLYGEHRIVSDKWIEQLLYPTALKETTWGFEKSQYALCWYHASYKGTPFIYAMGWGGQFMIIIPDQQVVITANESVHEATAIRQSAYFTNQVFPVIYKHLLQQ